MAKVILDTNFILTAIRNKLDFFEELQDLGYKVLIPLEVKQEIKRLMDGRKKLRFKQEAELALRILENSEYEEVSIGGRYVDVGLKDYLKKNPEVVLGTLDKELKRAVSNRKIVIRNKKKLELQ
jgi:rRNA-processing protein FCF1